MAFNTIQWDLSVRDRHNNLTLAVEVKNLLNKSPEWAMKLRKNHFAHWDLPKAPYFLMVFPDRFYLWTNNEPESEPAYIIDAAPILQRYFDRLRTTADDIGSDTLISMMSWLMRIIHTQSPQDIDKSQQWLIDSGLYPALFQGEFEPEVI